MFIQTEATPNPATLKFLPGREVLRRWHRRLPRRRAGAREASPLAGRLFDIPGVTGVFFGYDFITVTKDGNPNGSTSSRPSSARSWSTSCRARR